MAEASFTRIKFSKDPVIRHHQRGWYVVAEGTVNPYQTATGQYYLHLGGSWRSSTIGEGGKATGFFATEPDARAALKAYLEVPHMGALPETEQA